ncbi:MAG: acyl-CoA dehydrogenase family protein [Myxococcota bacterium]|nr:acyl-CoA dehydrogenase family protein [Myxococcota bacterium]
MAYQELNVALSDEQEQLKQEVHKFAVEVLRPASLKIDKMAPEEVVKQGSLYWDCMKQMYDLGYHSIAIPNEYGGLGLDPLGIHIVYEEIAYGSVGFAVSLGTSSFAALISSLIAEDHLIERYVAPYASCKDASILSCWGITEPDHGSDTLMPFTPFYRNPKITHQVRAEKDGDNWIINGQKSAWINNTPVASNCVLYLGLDKSMGMAGGGIAIVDFDQPGVSKGKPLDKLGQRELSQSEIYFDNVVCPKEDMLIDPESYEMITDVTLAITNGYMGAWFTGLAQAAYDLALQYSKERVQGGVYLCEHQNVQKKLFDMFVKVETARAYSRAALIYNMNNNPPHTQYSIASKVYCTQVAYEIAHEAVQIFGGYGLSKEYPIEKLFRDARAGLIEDGSNDILALSAAHLILDEGAS